MTADPRPLFPDDDPDGWQDFLAPCPEHGRTCGPWCDVLWGRPALRLVSREPSPDAGRLLLWPGLGEPKGLDDE